MFSEIQLIDTALVIAREFFNGTVDGSLEEIGSKIVNLFQRKLIGGFNKGKTHDGEAIKDELHLLLKTDNEFKTELQKLIRDYQSEVNNVYQSGNTGTTIGINNVGGDQFFR